MSYSLGQAKLVPGQIAFQTTPTGRLRSLQPLIEAGLPIAPYIEHGSYATGQPAIMRYGRDPYRGLGSSAMLPTNTPQMACEASGGRWVSVPGGPPPRCEGGTREMIETTVTETIRATLPAAIMISTGVVAGAAGGIAGGLLNKTILGALAGAVGGGILGYLGWKTIASTPPPAPPSAVAGLSGMLAVV
jgi:hypothetical protein